MRLLKCSTDCFKCLLGMEHKPDISVTSLLFYYFGTSGVMFKIGPSCFVINGYNVMKGIGACKLQKVCVEMV